MEKVKKVSKSHDIEVEEKKKEEKRKSGNTLIEKTELEERIHNVASRLIKHYRDYVYPEWFNIVKMKQKFAGDMLAINMLRGHEARSSMVYPLIDAVHDTYNANLYDTNSTSKAIPREEDDKELAEDAQDYFDWAYSVARADEEIELIRNEASLIGTSYGISAMMKQNDFYTLSEDMKSIIKEDSDIYLPFSEHISAFQMYVEPSTRDFYKARYKIVRRLISTHDIQDRYDWAFDLDEDTRKTKRGEIKYRDLIVDSDEFVSRYDFTKIYDIKSYQDDYIRAASVYFRDNDGAHLTGDFIYDNMFQVDYGTDKLCEVIEYWEREKLVIMVNGYVLYDSVNPYGIDPFGVITYEKRPGTHLGVGIGQKLMSHQRQVNTVWNAVNDGINKHVRPMYTATAGSLKDPSGNPIERIRWRDGEVVYSDNPNVSNGGIEPLQTVDFNIIKLGISHIRDLLGEAQEIIGTNAYVQGGQGKVERSFGAVNARLGVTRARLQPIIKSINKFDEKMFNVWLLTSAILMKEGVKIRILGEDDVKKWKTIKPQALLNKFDVVVENEANRQATKMERASIMLQSLQTILPNLYDQSTGMPIADIRGIIKFAVEQNNFVGIDIFSQEKIEEYMNDQAALAKHFSELQQELKAAQGGGEMGGNPGAGLAGALDGPLKGLESQLQTLDSVAGEEDAATVPQTRGVFPE